jgi:ferric-dicitrate binding protein FerR (iron transport regulator)
MRHDEELAMGRTDAAEQSVARLLKFSGERTTPAEDATARAHAAALDAWQSCVKLERLRNRRHVRWRIAAALSAVAIGAIVWASFEMRVPLDRVVAHFVIASHDTKLVASSGVERTLAAGAAVLTRSQLVTAEGGAALNIGDSLSLRVNKHSRVRFDAENQITLLAGMVYVDSGGLSAHSDLRILTPSGEVRHEGTQYQVSVADGATRIQVREGRVRLTGSDKDGVLHITAGEGVDVDGGGHISRHTINGFGPEWEWATALAMPLDIENRPLVEFLAWIARENGWQLRYATFDLEREAQSIRLHGVAKGKNPEDTLQRVALLTGMPMYVDNGILVVGGGRKATVP